MAMQKNPHLRYERDADGRILVDIAATRTEDLYNTFDRTAPFSRRDLDENLFKYIIECARELKTEPFSLRISFANYPDQRDLATIEQSVHSFFAYRAGAEHHTVRKLVLRSLAFFALGVGILFASVWLGKWQGAEPSVIGDVFAQGLTVAAWVSLWEALAGFLLKWIPSRRTIRLYQMLATTPVIFRRGMDAGPTRDGLVGFSD
jgi:hypothetical protein